MAEKKAAKLPAQRFARSTSEEASAIAAALGRVGRPKLAPDVGNGVVQSSSLPQLRPCGGNVEARKSEKHGETAGNKIAAGLDDVLAYARGDESRATVRVPSAVKCRAETAETAKNPQPLREKATPRITKPAVSAVISEVRAAIAKIPSKLSAETAGNFRSRLKGIGMTQSEFARLTDTPQRTVESWSNVSPPANMLVMVWLLEVVPDLRAVLEARK